MLSKQTIPVLRIFDVDKAKEFYVDWLGFTVDWEHKYEENFPLYMQISRDNLVLHLTEHHGDCCPGSKVYVMTDTAQELHEELIKKNYKYNKPDFEKDHFQVLDPFGNKIWFNHPK